MSFEPHTPPADGARYLQRRRYGLQLTPTSPRATSPFSSPNRITLEEYEKEGREEARKELEALFKQLEEQPSLTRKLPHVRKALRNNERSSTRKERSKRSSKRSKSTLRGIYIVAILAFVGIVSAGAAYLVWDYLSYNSLPTAASGSTWRLISALQKCTDHPSQYGLEEEQVGDSSGSKNRYRSECVHLADAAHGLTPLHLASQYGNLQSVLLLLEAGANVNEVNRQGVTALHLAATEEISVALLKAGANADAKDQFSRTPLFMCKTEAQIKALIDGHPERFLQRDLNGATTLQSLLRSALTTSGSYAFRFALEKANFLLRHTPKQHVSYLVSYLDFGQESAIQTLVKLASSSPDAERSKLSSSLLSQALSLVLASGDEPSINKVANLDIASQLVSTSALGALEQMLVATQQSANFSRVFDVSRLDSTGRYPISYCRSADTLRLLMSFGVLLHPTAPNPTNDPVHQILQSLSLRGANMESQFKLVKEIKERDETFGKYLDSVPNDVKTMIERRLSQSVAPEDLDWNIHTFMLGLEMLSNSKYQYHSKIALTTSEKREFAHHLTPGGSAQFNFTVSGLDPNSLYALELDAESEVDNVHIEMMFGDVEHTKKSSHNSFFGSMPRIRLPFGKRLETASDPYFTVNLVCDNHLMPCEAVLNVQTFEITDDHPGLRAPLIHSQFDYAFHLYSLARFSAIFWLPLSMLPQSVPIFIRFSLFFTSLAGFYSAGIIFLLYWIGYTTLAHILIRIMFASTTIR